MSACSTPLPGAPLVRLTLAGSGEPLLRMEKCLACAAAGAGIALALTPVVMLDGRVILKGSLRTEEIECFLRQRFTQANLRETEIPIK